MKSDKLGIYIHIPFCIKKCNYCDFCSFPDRGGALTSAYVAELIKRINAFSRQYGKRVVDTVYFGGGTPTLLSSDDFSKILCALREDFDILEEAEITAECNPASIDEEGLCSLRALGINRLSIGLQSANDNELLLLGRLHSFKEFCDTFYSARRAGFDNISVDLMYGIPEQTKESFLKSLQYVVSLEPAHISVYGLIIEENTVFGKIKNSLDLPNEDEEADMYFQACSFLRDNAYKHYEISNFSKDGFQSLHNLRYWKAREYIGVGLSAYSYFNGSRYGNSSMLSEYLMSYEKNRACEKIDKTAELFEYAMLHLRLSSGICLSEYKARFGEDFLKPRQELIEAYEKAGYLKCDGTCVALTEKGFYVSNTILADLI